MVESIVLMTHSGVFHADDVFATAFLMKHFKTNHTVHVSNVLDEIPNFDKSATFNIDKHGNHVIVYDIGGGRFDHHQKNAMTRETGHKYCSFGLLWKEFGLEYIESVFGTEYADDIWRRFDKYFVRPIDLHDNGYEQNPISAMIKKYNSTWIEDKDDPNANVRGFNEALKFASTMIDRELQYQYASIVGEAHINHAIDDAIKECRNYIILDQYIPYGGLVNRREDAKSIQFAIYPSKYNPSEVCIGTVEIPGEYGKFRKGIADDLRGIPKDKLMKNDWTFVHSSGFLGAALNEHAAIKMIEYSSK